MKLVEILAREWFEWPINHDGPLAQNAHGGIYIPGSFRVDGFDAGLCMSVKQADDWRIAIVTRAQWEAERARIAGLDALAKEHTGEAITSVLCSAPGYEQELWDKVAVSAMQSLTSSYWESQDAFEDAKALVKCQCEGACEYADAFMAERAKRMKGVK